MQNSRFPRFIRYASALALAVLVLFVAMRPAAATPKHNTEGEGSYNGHAGLTNSADRTTGTASTGFQLLLPDGTTQDVKTFGEAISLAGENRGSTITLFEPVALGYTVTVPDGTTINLNSQGGVTYAAISGSSEPPLRVESGSTVAIVNTGATQVARVQNPNGVFAIENKGTLLLGSFVQVLVASGGTAVYGNAPQPAPGAFIVDAPGSSRVSAVQVVQPENQTAAYSGSEGETVVDLLAYVATADSGVTVPVFQLRDKPAEDPTTPSGAPDNEWVLATGPGGATVSDADELVTGDYTFTLRPQGATGDYYGYTVTLTVSVTMPQTVDELRETYRQKLAHALAAYAEADYLADDWADIEAAYQQALDAINAATDETAMQEAVAGFQAAANLELTAAERLAAEQGWLLAELDQAYAAYDKADYTAEGWAELTAAYEQGRRGIASATSIADAQTAQQAALSAMAAVAQKPADPETDPDATPATGDPDAIPATGDPAAIAALMGLGGSAMLAVGVVARKRG